MKWIGFTIAVLMMMPMSGMAQKNVTPQKQPKTKTYDVLTDLPPPPAAKDPFPTDPFFAEPTGAHEVMEQVQDLEEKVKNLDERLTKLEGKAQEEMDKKKTTNEQSPSAKLK